MQNPWRDLPGQPPYVLPADQPHIEAWNSYPRLNPRYQFCLSLIPQPFLGNARASLVVLGANPDLQGGHHDGPYAKALRANLLSDGHDGSLLGLTDRFADGPNAKCWRRCFRAVVDALRCDPAEIAPRILSVEFLGYHSAGWKLIPTIPSQFFGFGLVDHAMERSATIVVMRAERVWRAAIPALTEYPQLVTLKNPRSNAISLQNCVPGGFEKVVESLRGVNSV
jgi:hypothetical protein